MARLVDTVSRGYATTTTKPKRKTTVKKTVTKKTIKKAKKPKKKVVKKPKKRVAKKPVKVLKPKVAKLPSRYGISGYAMFLKNALSSTSGPGAAGRLTDASAQWKALSDSEKEVIPICPYVPTASCCSYTHGRRGKLEHGQKVLLVKSNTKVPSPNYLPRKSKKRTKNAVSSPKITPRPLGQQT